MNRNEVATLAEARSHSEFIHYPYVSHTLENFRATFNPLVSKHDSGIIYDQSGTLVAEVARLSENRTSDIFPETSSSVLRINIPELKLEIRFEADPLDNKAFELVKIKREGNGNRKDHWAVDRFGHISPKGDIKALKQALHDGKKFLRQKGVDIPWEKEEQEAAERRELLMTALPYAVTSGGIIYLVGNLAYTTHRLTKANMETIDLTLDNINLARQLREKEKLINQLLPWEKDNLVAAGLGGFVDYYATHNHLIGKYNSAFFTEITHALALAANGQESGYETLSQGWADKRDPVKIRQAVTSKISSLTITGTDNPEALKERLYRIARIYPLLVIAGPEHYEIDTDVLFNMTYERIHMGEAPDSTRPDYDEILIHELNHYIDPGILNFEVLNRLKPLVPQTDLAAYLEQYLHTVDEIITAWVSLPVDQALQIDDRQPLLFSGGYFGSNSDWRQAMHRLRLYLELKSPEIRKTIYDNGLTDNLVGWWNVVAHQYMKQLLHAYQTDPETFTELSSDKYALFRHQILSDVEHQLVNPAYRLRNDIIGPNEQLDMFRLQAATLEVKRLKLLSYDGRVQKLSELETVMYAWNKELNNSPIDGEYPESVRRIIQNMENTFLPMGAYFEGAVRTGILGHQGLVQEIRAYRLPKAFEVDKEVVLLTELRFDENDLQATSSTAVLIPKSSDIPDPDIWGTARLTFNLDFSLQMARPENKSDWSGNIGLARFYYHGRKAETEGELIFPFDAQSFVFSSPVPARVSDLIYTEKDGKLISGVEKVNSLLVGYSQLGTRYTLNVPLPDSLEPIAAANNPIRVVHAGFFILAKSGDTSWTVFKDTSMFDLGLGMVYSLEGNRLRLVSRATGINFKLDSEVVNLIKHHLSDPEQLTFVLERENMQNRRVYGDTYRLKITKIHHLPHGQYNSVAITIQAEFIGTDSNLANIEETKSLKSIDNP